MTCIHIYSDILVCYNCMFIHRYRVWDIIHDAALGSCLKKSLCHVALSYEIDDILLSIAGGKSYDVVVPCITYADDWLTEMLNATALWYWNEILLHIGSYICLNDKNSYCWKIFYFSKCYAFIHIERSFNVQINSWSSTKIYITWGFHNCICRIYWGMQNKCWFIHSCEKKIWCT